MCISCPLNTLSKFSLITRTHALLNILHGHLLNNRFFSKFDLFLITDGIFAVVQ